MNRYGQTKPRKVLYVSHGHPAVQAGGAEKYALELYEGMRSSRDFEPILLARVPQTGLHHGTPFGAAPGDRNQYFWHTKSGDFNPFYMSSPDKTTFTKHFREFLLAHRPEIIHFQHTYFLGCDLIREARNTLPNAPIVYTLHEYLPICYRAGQMVRVKNQELCLESSPSRCHECFPDISPQDFFMRQRFIQSQFALVDMFLAPSHFLLGRYVDWGIPREKIRFEEYGRHPVTRMTSAEGSPKKNRLGFFGQLNPFKGPEVLFRAMKLLAKEDVHLWVHGANLDLQRPEFQKEFRSLVDSTANVTFAGSYEHRDLPRLMSHLDWVVVPSIWWENAPLVIQEAFQHGRPVICSDIGGMAEKVTDGVNGLHFRRADPVSLAAAIKRAVKTPGLWDSLRANATQIYRMDDQVRTLGKLYESLLDKRRAAVNNEKIVAVMPQVATR